MHNCTLISRRVIPEKYMEFTDVDNIYILIRKLIT
jgi:hypothetical protein